MIDIDELLVKLIKGLPSVKSLFRKLDKNTGNLIDAIYEDNEFVIVGIAPVERGKDLVAISVQTTNEELGRPLYGGATPYRILSVTIGFYCEMEDKACMRIKEDIQGLDQNVELFWNPFKFDIESIEVSGPIPDESDEQKNHHKVFYDVVINYKTTNIPPKIL